MSAFTVSQAHIDALVRVALGSRYFMFNGKQLHLSNASELGQLLWDENYKSVNYRYKEKDSAPTYKHNLNSPRRTPVQNLKLIQCYDYQTCEHPDYKGSEVERITHSLTRIVVCSMDGYGQADWSI